MYYPNEKETGKAIIAMLGDSSDDWMAVSGAKWMHKQKKGWICVIAKK